MKKKVLLKLLDTEYPNDKANIQMKDIEYIFENYNTHVNEFTLFDNGRIYINNFSISDINKYLQFALDEVFEFSPTVRLKTWNPNQRTLLKVIREMNKRGKIVSKVEALEKETYIYFESV